MIVRLCQDSREQEQVESVTFRCFVVFVENSSWMLQEVCLFQGFSLPCVLISGLEILYIVVLFFLFIFLSRHLVQQLDKDNKQRHFFI